MLKVKGNFIIPKNVPANEFLNLEGRNFNFKNWPGGYPNIKDFPDKQDVLRYVLTIMHLKIKIMTLLGKIFKIEIMES